MLEALISAIQQAILQLGPLGIFVGMVIESSVVPIPSEIVLIGAGLIGFSVADIVLWGSLGSTTGSMIGYCIGRFGGRPFLDRYGRYFFIKGEKLKFVDRWLERWGAHSVFVSRVIPLLPFKIFSIAFGIGKTNFKKFIIFTFLGCLPRTFLLGYFGHLLLEISNLVIISIVLAIAIALPVITIHWRIKVK